MNGSRQCAPARWLIINARGVFIAYEAIDVGIQIFGYVVCNCAILVLPERENAGTYMANPARHSATACASRQCHRAASRRDPDRPHGVELDLSRTRSAQGCQRARRSGRREEAYGRSTRLRAKSVVKGIGITFEFSHIRMSSAGRLYASAMIPHLARRRPQFQRTHDVDVLPRSNAATAFFISHFGY